MKTANTVFWCSLFVNQRGCSQRDHLKSLFSYLVENNAYYNELKQDEKEGYEREFVKTHDDLLDKFVESIDAICDEWVESDAGVAFIAMYEKRRYFPLCDFSKIRKNHKPRPEFTAESLRSFAHDAELKSGVLIDGARIWSIFEPILWIYDTEEVSEVSHAQSPS
jgi:hypothetical protein